MSYHNGYTSCLVHLYFSNKIINLLFYNIIKEIIVKSTTLAPIEHG